MTPHKTDQRVKLPSNFLRFGICTTLCAAILGCSGEAETDNVPPRSTVTALALASAPSTCTQNPVNVASAWPDGRFAWGISGSFGIPADTNEETTRSVLRVFEDGVEIGPAHATHVDIRQIGMGRFSHYANVDGSNESIRLSATNGSNVKTNGKAYTYCIAMTSSAVPTVEVSVNGASSLPATGDANVNISFANGKPAKVELARDDDRQFAVWPNGALAQYYTQTPAGLEFALCLSCMTPGNHILGVKATYADGRTASASTNITIAISPVATPRVITPLTAVPSVAPITPSSIPAFPGAEGYGAAAVGGRGGRVIAVTNLNDSGPGSFRAALTATGARTVVFRVGGTIDLLSDINISGEAMSYLTVAGQTAPGGGIQTRNKTINITEGAHDIVIRYLRHRHGWSPAADSSNNNNGPGLMLFSNDAPVYNVILDHNSFAWAQDDTGTWNFVHDVTWQWNILAEAKNTHTGPLDMKGINGKGNNHGVEPGNGMALSNISIHHNFLVNNFARNPALSGNGPIELVNNLIYNYAAFGTQIQNRGGGTRLNIIGNYYKAGPDTFANRYALLVDQAMIYDVGTYSLEQTSESMYVHDNLSPQRTASSQPEWNVVGYCASTGVYCTAAAPSSFQRTTPWPSSRFPITISSAANVPAIVLSGVGANLPSRDTTDARLVREYQSDTGSIHTYNDWPVLANGTAPADSDEDGIPDTWEIAHGLNPNDVADGAAITPNGYTNLENYLNEIVSLSGS